MHWADIEPLDAEYERALAHMRRDILAGLILLGVLIIGLLGRCVGAILWAAGVL